MRALNAALVFSESGHKPLPTFHFGSYYPDYVQHVLAQLMLLSGTVKAFVAALTSLALVLAIYWLVLELRAKSKYDHARQETSIVYRVAPMDQQIIAFLTEVQSNWTRKSDITNGPESETLKLAGMTPSVRNYIDVFNYQMPQYRWLSPSQNRKAAKLALIKATFMPISVDQRWYLSEDQHLAVLYCKTNLVYVYQDEEGGLRATLYFRKKNEIGRANTSPLRKEKTP